MSTGKYDYLTGDVLKAQVNNLPLIFHYGIVVTEGNDVFIWHNCPNCLNKQGGSVVKEPLSDWLKTRKIIAVEKTGISKTCIEKVASDFSSHRFDVLGFNCEHFITCIKNGAMQSPQVYNWVVLFLAGLLLFSGKD